MRIEHIAVWVRDIERTRQFFETYFGAVASSRYDNARGFSSYFLTLPDGKTRIEIMQQPGVTVKIIPCTGHFAISVGSKESVDQLTQRLVNDGYNLASGPRTTGDGYYESCFHINAEFILELTI